MSTPKVTLANKVPIKGKPPWTAFTFDVHTGGTAPSELRRELRRLLPEAICPDSDVHDRQVKITIVDSQLDRARQLLKGKFPGIASLLT